MQKSNPETPASAGKITSKTPKFSKKQCLEACRDDSTCLNMHYVQTFHPMEPAMDAIPGKDEIPAVLGKDGKV